VCAKKPWDVRLRLEGREPTWRGEIGLDDWLMEHHPATVTPDNKGTVWLCHNLDFATSGMIVAAKSKEAAGEVSRLFREREADKLYAALCFGWPTWDERLIKARIRVSQRRFKQRIAPDGKSAETLAIVGARGRLTLPPHAGRKASLVWLSPRTGRRHQLRLHMSHVGHPLVGDLTYADDKECYRTFLHAAAIRLPLRAPFAPVAAYAPLEPRGWADAFLPEEPLRTPAPAGWEASAASELIQW
jgi:23S rRNA-/tRNA-specific pseudouridylate synthase